MRYARLIIHGQVHGVGFRAFVEGEAMTRGLSGWVRNRRGGSVEAVLAGDDATISGMIDACRHGPPAARVNGIDILEAKAGDLDARERGEKFSVLATV